MKAIWENVVCANCGDDYVVYVLCEYKNHFFRWYFGGYIETASAEDIEVCKQFMSKMR